jgi:hypothetical protein
LAAIAEEIEQSVAEQDIFELAESGNHVQAFLVHRMHSQIVTFLKALYVSSDIFISIFISERLNYPGIKRQFVSCKQQIINLICIFVG